MHLCASKNNIEVAQRLIEHKATTRVKDQRGQLPLHRAAAIGSVPLIKILLENKSPLNATDADGQTALHHGRVCGYTELTTLLTLFTAISEGHGDAALFLLKEGAETDKRDVNKHLAIELAPDTKVFLISNLTWNA